MRFRKCTKKFAGKQEFETGRVIINYVFCTKFSFCNKPDVEYHLLHLGLFPIIVVFVPYPVNILQTNSVRSAGSS